jgi:hypothetical protein
METESFNGFESEEPPVPTLSLEEKEKIIGEAKDLDDLYQKLDQIVSLQGSKDVYESSELKSIIERVRNGELDTSYITRTGGLRKKVKDFLGTGTENQGI